MSLAVVLPYPSRTPPGELKILHQFGGIPPYSPCSLFLFVPFSIKDWTQKVVANDKKIKTEMVTPPTTLNSNGVSMMSIYISTK